MAKPVELRDPAVHRIAISGASLAFMLQDFSFSQGDCDGIIFGHLQRRSTVNLQDDDEEQQVTHEEITAMVTGYCCSGTLFSFYDATGRIHHKKLANLIGERERRGGDPVIGWFVGRRSTPLRPSMREIAVTSHLRLLTPQTRTLSSETRGDRQGSAGGDNSYKSGAILVSGRADDNLLLSKNHAQDGGPSNDVPITKEDRVSGQGIRINSGIGASASSNLGIKSGASSSSGSANIGRKLLSTGVESSSRNVGHSVEVKIVQARENNFPGSGAFPSQPSSPSRQAVGIPHSSPCLFLLLSESGSRNEVQTHEYKAFQYHRKSEQIGTFEPRTITIINVGPAFRGLYNVFTPVSPFPWLSGMSELEEGSDEVDSLRGSTDIRKGSVNSFRSPSQVVKTSSKREERMLNLYAEGYSLGKLNSFFRENGHEGVSNLEDLYAGMLMKLETLAKEVSENATALAEQVQILSFSTERL
ncbi:hypothetical protein O6H91_11G085400 [Diphasiastrum complanatum]|uniref:Uncharacterized protein n=1 Tax=Diphasiastrum complanatum TaxID=34168 RepID=A0ACC2CB84_DIPCM|nr:hypothetical protein O6H91_11G085400 [Diphasiastrum complanatum]